MCGGNDNTTCKLGGCRNEGRGKTTEERESAVGVKGS